MVGSLGVGAITVGIAIVLSHVTVPNLSVIYVLLVLWLGSRYGKAPAVVASLLAFAAYDYFFVPPVGAFTVAGPSQLLELILLLTVALVTGQLVASLKKARVEAEAAAADSGDLYDLATAVLRLPDGAAALDLICKRAQRLPSIRSFSLLSIESGGPHAMAGDSLGSDELRQVSWAFKHRQAIGCSGGITVLGLALGLTTYYYSRGRQPAVFPFLHRPGVPVVHVGGLGRLARCEVLAILPTHPEIAEAVVSAAIRAADGASIAFLYRGDPKSGSQEVPELMEHHHPYLKDRPAQVAFARAERAARKRSRDRRYIYVPGDLRQSAVGDVWKAVFPKQTVVAEGAEASLPGIAVDRVRRTYFDGYPILRLVSGRRTAAGAN